MPLVKRYQTLVIFGFALALLSGAVTAWFWWLRPRTTPSELAVRSFAPIVLKAQRGGARDRAEARTEALKRVEDELVLARITAADTLAFFTDDEAFEALKKLSTDTELSVRLRALMAVSRESTDARFQFLRTKAKEERLSDDERAVALMGSLSLADRIARKEVASLADQAVDFSLQNEGEPQEKTTAFLMQRPYRIKRSLVLLKTKGERHGSMAYLARFKQDLCDWKEAQRTIRDFEKTYGETLCERSPSATKSKTQ